MVFLKLIWPLNPSNPQTRKPISISRDTAGEYSLGDMKRQAIIMEGRSVHTLRRSP